jgi:hypothetical protein
MALQMTNPHFHAGQRVVCVDASPNRLCGVKLLTRGAIYVVRAIDVKPKWQASGWGVHLEEIRIVHPAGMEWPFHPRRFRPITPRKTDISMFTKMLAKPRRTPQLPLPIRLPGELPLVWRTAGLGRRPMLAPQAAPPCGTHASDEAIALGKRKALSRIQGTASS